MPDFAALASRADTLGFLRERMRERHDEEQRAVDPPDYEAFPFLCAIAAGISPKRMTRIRASIMTGPPGASAPPRASADFAGALGAYQSPGSAAGGIGRAPRAIFVTLACELATIPESKLLIAPLRSGWKCGQDGGGANEVATARA